MRVFTLTVAVMSAAAAVFLIRKQGSGKQSRQLQKEEPNNQEPEKEKAVKDLAHQLEEAWSDHHTLVA